MSNQTDMPEEERFYFAKNMEDSVWLCHVCKDAPDGWMLILDEGEDDSDYAKHLCLSCYRKKWKSSKESFYLEQEQFPEGHYADLPEGSWLCLYCKKPTLPQKTVCKEHRLKEVMQ